MLKQAIQISAAIGAAVLVAAAPAFAQPPDYREVLVDRDDCLQITQVDHDENSPGSTLDPMENVCEDVYLLVFWCHTSGTTKSCGDGSLAHQPFYTHFSQLSPTNGLLPNTGGISHSGQQYVHGVCASTHSVLHEWEVWSNMEGDYICGWSRDEQQPGEESRSEPNEGIDLSSPWGDDQSEYANDGECDDPRFVGPGMYQGSNYEEDIRHDATDCREQYEAGRIRCKVEGCI